MTIEERIACLEQEIKRLNGITSKVKPSYSYYIEAREEIRTACFGKRGFVDDYGFFEKLMGLASHTYKKKIGRKSNQQIESFIRDEESKKEFSQLAKQLLDVCDRFQNNPKKE